MRSSYATAYYLAFMLQQMCDNVHLLTTSTSDLPTALSDVRPEDCLLVISYARYTSSSTAGTSPPWEPSPCATALSPPWAV